MNTAPVIQTSVQPSVGPPTAPGADNTANAGGAQSTFAGALNAAGAKPSRRAGASKQSDDGGPGGSLPPAGNQSPPPPPPQAAAAATVKSHVGGSSANDRPRMERGKAVGSAAAENPLAAQAAVGAAALIDGAKSPSGTASSAVDRKVIDAGQGGAAGGAARGAAVAAAVASINAAAGAPAVASTNAAAGAPAGASINAATAAATNGAAAAAAATKAATNGAIKNAATFDAAGRQFAIEARNESALAAKSAATAAQASATVAADAAAAAKPNAPAPGVSLESNSALATDAAATRDLDTTPDAAVNSSAPASSAPAAAVLQAASAAADKASAKPHAAALRPISSAMGRTIAPAVDSGTASADGGEADSTLKASSPSGDTSSAVGAVKVPAPTIPDTGAQDAAAAAAAVAGTPQPANTGKAGGDNSYDSDASLSALQGGAQAAAAAPPGRPGMRATSAPPLAANAANAASAPLAVDSGKHAHGGFDLAALTGSTGDAAAGLSQLNGNGSAGAPADATPAAALRVHASVDSAEFSQGLSDRVSWMVDNGVNGAKLQVNPPQLGPIELRISVQGDHAQVWMTTHSAVARDALEASSPKLRDMLSAQGFGQVSVDISQRSFQDRSAYVPPYQREQAGVHSAALAAVPTTAASAPRSLLGALDAYA